MEKSRSTRREKSHHQTFHFNLFDLTVDGVAPKVVGQDDVQTKIYRALKSFTRQRLNNRLLLLHGPNGSAKSTIVRALMGGLERYSRTPEGATYTFNWVFPVERLTKASMGLQAYEAKTKELGSFSKLPDEEVAARFPCDMKDHPDPPRPLQMNEEMSLFRLLGEEKGAEVYTQFFELPRKKEISAIDVD